MNVAEPQNWSFLSGRTAAIDNLLNMASSYDEIVETAALEYGISQRKEPHETRKHRNKGIGMIQ